jgi:hypothetical protein
MSKLPELKNTLTNVLAKICILGLSKGDLAPPLFQIMSISNPGGIFLGFFGESPFPLVHSAVMDLCGNHYDDTPKQQILRRSSTNDPWLVDPVTTPTSDRYAPLIPGLLAAKVVCPPSDFQDAAEASGTLRLVVLRLFAVVKDLPSNATC